jgi:hypothetical protein
MTKLSGHIGANTDIPCWHWSRWSGHWLPLCILACLHGSLSVRFLFGFSFFFACLFCHDFVQHGSASFGFNAEHSGASVEAQHRWETASSRCYLSGKSLVDGHPNRVVWDSGLYTRSLHRACGQRRVDEPPGTDVPYGHDTILHNTAAKLPPLVDHTSDRCHLCSSILTLKPYGFGGSTFAGRRWLQLDMLHNTSSGPPVYTGSRTAPMSL